MYLADLLDSIMGVYYGRLLDKVAYGPEGADPEIMREKAQYNLEISGIEEEELQFHMEEVISDQGSNKMTVVELRTLLRVEAKDTKRAERKLQLRIDNRAYVGEYNPSVECGPIEDLPSLEGEWVVEGGADKIVSSII